MGGRFFVFAGFLGGVLCFWNCFFGACLRFVAILGGFTYLNW